MMSFSHIKSCSGEGVSYNYQNRNHVQRPVVLFAVLCVGVRLPRHVIVRHNVTRTAATIKISRAQLKVLHKSAANVVAGYVDDPCSCATSGSDWKRVGDAASDLV